MIQLAVLAPLRRRDFRLFWLGQWISLVGDNLFLVAETWLVWELTGSGAAMATLMLCSQVPAVAMILLGGVLVDRLPRRFVAGASDVIRGALLLMMAALYGTGALRLWHLYLLGAVFGLVSAFARPALSALVQSLAPPGDRTAANALISTGATVAGIIGPTLGGLALGAGSAGLAFALDGFSFWAAAGALLLARPPEPALREGRGAIRLTTLLPDLREALRLVAADRFLLTGIAVMSVINVTGQAPVILLRPWAAQQAGGGVSTLSLGYTSFALGMALTVVLLSAVRIYRGRGVFVFGGMLAAGVTMIGMSFPTVPWLFWLLQFVLGGAIMVFGVLWPSLLQERVPPETMGRVAAIDEFGRLVLYPAGITLVGMLTAGVPGPAAVMLTGGLLTAALGGLAMLLPWMHE